VQQAARELGADGVMRRPQAGAEGEDHHARDKGSEPVRQIVEDAEEGFLDLPQREIAGPSHPDHLLQPDSHKAIARTSACGR
jgi:hypothetical protein